MKELIAFCIIMGLITPVSAGPADFLMEMFGKGLESWYVEVEFKPLQCESYPWGQDVSGYYRKELCQDQDEKVFIDFKSEQNDMMYAAVCGAPQGLTYRAKVRNSPKIIERMEKDGWTIIENKGKYIIPNQTATNKGPDANALELSKQINEPVTVDGFEGYQEMMQEKKQLMQQEIEQTKNKSDQEILKNQNRIRVAVLTFLAVEEAPWKGGIGQDIGQIARDFNNSVQKTINAELRLQKRSRWQEFWYGGDYEAAEEIEAELESTEEKVLELEELIQAIPDNHEEDIQAKDILAEELASLKQERERLRELAKETKEKTGILQKLRFIK